MELVSLIDNCFEIQNQWKPNILRNTLYIYSIQGPHSEAQNTNDNNGQPQKGARRPGGNRKKR